MRMAPPTALTRGYGSHEVEVISRWWNGLSTSERRRLRAELEDRPGWPVAVVPLRLRKEDRPEHDQEHGRFPLVDFYEYLVGHEMIREERRFFIMGCAAHADARRTIEEGSISTTFVCPLGRSSCPMRTIVERAIAMEKEVSA